MANYHITYRARVTMTVDAETEQDALREAERRARVIEHDETIVRGLPVYIGGFDTEDPDEIERVDLVPCDAEPPTGMAHNSTCELDEDHAGDHQNIARNWPNRDAEEWGPDSAQQALERGPR